MSNVSTNQRANAKTEGKQNQVRCCFWVFLLLFLFFKIGFSLKKKEGNENALNCSSHAEWRQEFTLILSQVFHFLCQLCFPLELEYIHQTFSEKKISLQKKMKCLMLSSLFLFLMNKLLNFIRIKKVCEGSKQDPTCGAVNYVAVQRTGP